VNAYRLAPPVPERPPLEEVRLQHFYGAGPTWQDVLAICDELVRWKRRWTPAGVA
jgi:hypothetical protein